MSSFTPFVTALRAPFTRWRLWLGIELGLPVWLALVWAWTLIPLARIWQLGLVALCALALIAVPLATFALVFRATRRVVFRNVAAYVAIAIWLALGLWMPGALVGWKPAFPSIAAEVTSMTLRFLAAMNIAIYVLLWLSAVLASDVTTAQPEQPEARA